MSWFRAIRRFYSDRKVPPPVDYKALDGLTGRRKPYRSLSTDVIRILEDDLGILLRGEIIWKKAEGAAGSCAWGSYRSPANPVLRDISERVVVASKGRFDRAVSADERRAEGRPYRPSISTDEFLEVTLDVWDMRPESARRVGHPAPFPVELPQRLIELYTFEEDLVLDPFVGSGSAAVAAVRTKRRYVGYDTDPAYIAIARERVTKELADRAERTTEHSGGSVILSENCGPDEPQRRWTEDGKAAQSLAVDILTAAGFTITGQHRRVGGVGIVIDLVAEDAEGNCWYFDVTRAFTSTRAGLVRTDTLWKCLGRASVLHSCGIRPVVLLTSHLPERRSTGDQALRRVGPGGVHDVMGMSVGADRARLAKYGCGGQTSYPLPGFWSSAELAAIR